MWRPVVDLKLFGIFCVVFVGWYLYLERINMK